MKYYYDIYLNFNDYMIPYYEWEESDKIERVMKIPIIRVLDIKDFLLYEITLEEEICDKFIISDGMNAVALEIINKKIAYISSMSYQDELSIIDILRNDEIKKIKYQRHKKRKIPFELRKDLFIKRILKKHIEECSDDLISYIYFDITNKENTNPQDMKKYILNDIDNNFTDKYINIYENICK